MQVWNRFEATISRELSQIQDNLQGMQPHKEQQPNSNYELFYRACSGIYPKGDITMGEFSSALAVPFSTATRIADWLVEDDRRVVRIALTETGKELYKAIDRYIRQRMQQVLSGLTAEERTTLLSLVAKVVSGLKEATQ